MVEGRASIWKKPQGKQGLLESGQPEEPEPKDQKKRQAVTGRGDADLPARYSFFSWVPQCWSTKNPRKQASRPSQLPHTQWTLMHRLAVLHNTSVFFFFSHWIPLLPYYYLLLSLSPLSRLSSQLFCPSSLSSFSPPTTSRPSFIPPSSRLVSPPRPPQSPSLARNFYRSSFGPFARRRWNPKKIASKFTAPPKKTPHFAFAETKRDFIQYTQPNIGKEERKTQKGDLDSHHRPLIYTTHALLIIVQFCFTALYSLPFYSHLRRIYQYTTP